MDLKDNVNFIKDNILINLKMVKKKYNLLAYISVIFLSIRGIDSIWFQLKKYILGEIVLFNFIPIMIGTLIALFFIWFYPVKILIKHLKE